MIFAAFAFECGFEVDLLWAAFLMVGWFEFVLGVWILVVLLF